MRFFWLWGLEFLKEMRLIFKHKSQDFVLLDNSCKAAEVLRESQRRGWGRNGPSDGSLPSSSLRCQFMLHIFLSSTSNTILFSYPHLMASEKQPGKISWSSHRQTYHLPWSVPISCAFLLLQWMISPCTSEARPYLCDLHLFTYSETYSLLPQLSSLSFLLRWPVFHGAIPLAPALS